MGAAQASFHVDRPGPVEEIRISAVPVIEELQARADVARAANLGAPESANPAGV